MINKVFILIMLCLSLVVKAQDDDVDSAFAKANKAYTAENYDVAAALYESALNGSAESPEVYYNLANAYYKLKRVAPAIYNYEKALQLAPGDVDIKTNLAYAQQLQIDAVADSGSTTLATQIREVINTLSIDNWAYLSLAFFLIYILCWILYYYSATSGKKRLFFILLIAFLIIALLSAYAAYSQYSFKETKHAIIFETEINTREEPKTTSKTVVQLHEGAKVQLLETYENWYKVKTPTGVEAWLPISSLKVL